MRQVSIRNVSSPCDLITAKYCDTFFSKLRGLMFSRILEKDCGIVLVEKYESKAGTSIHMMFVNYDITALWVNKDMEIVDKVLAKSWKPFYIPKKNAQYVVELHHSKMNAYSIGDKLKFEE